MNKVGMLLSELHDAVIALAEECREVAERQAADHGTHYPCLTLAQQCDAQAERVRAIARQSVGKELSDHHRSEALTAALGAARRKASELIGTRPESGLLLLRDLRKLYLAAEAVNLLWILLGQVAQALRDHELLDEVSGLHQQTLTQIRWITTRLKEASPQILVVPD